ncbi:MAG TPA: TetR/AcrR family transcriptional regulator [Caulobacteraceae bacterium]|nr:TetR/AcrR family transcriptional regulator [Caulobacteraceae bacterium]
MSGVRQSRKLATRERVLAAARELFQEIGYEGTTIRMVAQRAGVSVGSVFTTFSGKAEILSQVMGDRLESLYAELDQVTPHLRGATVDRLRSIMAVHYGFETRRLRLFTAYIGASYNWSPGEGVIPLGRNVRLKAMLRDTLLGGMERGEVRARADIDTFIDMLLAAYIWNYRLAVHEAADAAGLIARMDLQIGLLFDGVAAR